MLRNFSIRKPNKKYQLLFIAITEMDQEPQHDPKEVIGIMATHKKPKNHPLYVSMNILNKISHCSLIDGGSRHNVMSKKIWRS